MLPKRGLPLASPPETARFARHIRTTLDRLAAPARGGPADIANPLIVELLHLLSASREMKPDRTTSARRTQIVRQAEALVVDTPGVAIDPLQLCLMTGVSRRTLEYAFLDVTGLSPLAYLKVFRLNMVRRELHHHPVIRGAIHAVASRWGFFRSDHFAADYKRQFGELPSVAISRTVCVVSPVPVEPR